MTSMRNIAMELEYKAIPNQIKALGSIEQHVPQVVLLGPRSEAAVPQV